MSDSDIEGPAGEEAAARVRDPAEERRAAAEVLRQLRPEQDVRRLAVLVDPAILEDAGADILMEALDALSCEYRVEPERPAWSLRWSRVKPDPCSLSVPPEVWAADEQDWLLLLEPEEFLQGVVQLTQALVLLQLWANMDVLLVASWQELSQHVCAFTKALTQRPFKQSRESGAFSFCTTACWAAAEKSGKRWHRPAGAWWQQIRQFNCVSPAVANAVVAAFPSPCLLQQVCVACGMEQGRLALLADLPVRMGKGVRPHRLGPDFSRCICLFLTTTIPDLPLDLGS
ncbi:probable crossover junction endonuclease EME2 isoform X3 [Delphinapterus leucas]|uniref:Probable crossover junction endonuclease EME2 isoform X3 n=1 Tax=Delphinapterus leucas TaxID=9749 RepID=A0A2Y9PXF8_DELLE|nr:probable crossover junction endonuclease EME2 isoform X3 [Delphinapterus leucas]